MFPSFLQVKLSLRDDLVLTSGSINIHHHHRQHHPPPPSSRRSYDSPSSSSPASSNNDPPPPPISHSVASFAPLPPPLPPHFNSPVKQRPLGVPQPPPAPPKPGIFGSLAEAAVHSPVPSMTVVACRQQEQIAEDRPVDDPSMNTLSGKIKAFENMGHFAQAQRILEVQEAENARVGVTKSVQWSRVVLWDLEPQWKPAA